MRVHEPICAVFARLLFIACVANTIAVNTLFADPGAFSYKPPTSQILSASFSADFAALTAHRTVFGEEVNRAMLVDITTGLPGFDMSNDLFGNAAWPNSPAIDLGPLETGVFSVSVDPWFFPALAAGEVGLSFLATDTNNALFAIDFLSLTVETLNETIVSYHGPLGNGENNGFGLGIPDFGDLPASMPGVLSPTGTGFDEEISSKFIHVVPTPGAYTLLGLGLLSGVYSRRRTANGTDCLRGCTVRFRGGRRDGRTRPGLRTVTTTVILGVLSSVVLFQTGCAPKPVYRYVRVHIPTCDTIIVRRCFFPPLKKPPPPPASGRLVAAVVVDQGNTFELVEIVMAGVPVATSSTVAAAHRALLTTELITRSLYDPGTQSVQFFQTNETVVITGESYGSVTSMLNGGVLVTEGAVTMMMDLMSVLNGGTTDPMVMVDDLSVSGPPVTERGEPIDQLHVAAMPGGPDTANDTFILTADVQANFVGVPDINVDFEVLAGDVTFLSGFQMPDPKLVWLDTDSAGVAQVLVMVNSPDPVLIRAAISFSAFETFALLKFEGDSDDELVCYTDCDQSTGTGVLDIFDFLCFQNSFVNGEPYACDCDTSTGPLVCDIFDFLCFQSEFVTGCP